MNALERWLRHEVQSGNLSRRTPFRTWEVRHGPETRTKRLWAYSTLHRWVWNYCNRYQVYQEVPTDLASIQRWFRGEGVALHSIRGYFRVYNERMRHWLLEGHCPYPHSGILSDPTSDSAHTLVTRQMDAQGRRYILYATIQCAISGGAIAAGPTLGPMAGAASTPAAAVSLGDAIINEPSID